MASRWACQLKVLYYRHGCLVRFVNIANNISLQRDFNP